MVENGHHGLPELYRTRTSSSECLPAIEADLFVRNFSYPPKIFQALQTSTIDQIPRTEELYLDGLEELEDSARELDNDSIAGQTGNVEDGPEFTYEDEDIKARRKFLTSSRAALDNCLQPHGPSSELRKKQDSRVRRHHAGLFASISPIEPHSLGLSASEFEIDLNDKITALGNLQNTERIRQQKLNSPEDSFRRPVIPNRQCHKPGGSVDVNSGRLGLLTGESDLFTSEIPFLGTNGLPMSAFTKENNSLRTLPVRRGTISALARVDENAAMDHKSPVTLPRDVKPTDLAKPANTIVRSQSDSSSHPNNKKKEGRGSLRRKQKDDATKEKDGKSNWLHKMTDWWTVSEPSTQALKQHKKEVFKKAGISVDDPEAGMKLHVPMGEIPVTAIKPSGPGPEPEEIFKKQLEQKKKSAKSSKGNPVTTCRKLQTSSNQSDFPRQADAIFPFN